MRHVRRFVRDRIHAASAGLKLDRLPDETTILNLQHFREKHGLGKTPFKEVNKHLEKNGLMLREGGIVDATIIFAPSSTNNQTGKRDPEMYQTRKGNEWHFGTKMHIGVDDTLSLSQYRCDRCQPS